MIAGDKNEFHGLKTNNLFQKEEAAQTMLNKIIHTSPINFDTKSQLSPVAMSQTLSSKKTPLSPKASPFKRQQTHTIETPGKTFALTQGVQNYDSPTKKGTV